MVKHLKEFSFSVLAGMAIAVGCVVFLSVENAVIGSVLFSVGLLTVLVFKLNLFTGKAPYMCKNKPAYWGFVALVWLGNFVGMAISSTLVRFTRVYDKIIDRCTTVAQTKIDDDLLSLFILGIFCGIMMYIAVDTFINHGQEKNFSSSIVVVFCVSVFILSGFEHSIADMFYFMLALPISKWILPLIVITLGNVVGGNLFCYLTKIKRD